MVVAVGLTLIGVPLVAVIFPGVTTPVPPLKTAFRLEFAPNGIEAGLAVKLMMVGDVPTGITVTATFCVIAGPAVGVTVSV